MKSKAIIKHYAIISYWYNGLLSSTACWRAKEVGIEYSDEEKKKLYEASRLFGQAKELFSEIYSKRIGDAVTYEIRNGVEK